MALTQAEILEKIRTEGNKMTKSQKDHLKDIAKKRGRKEKRIQKQKLEQSNSKKLIEENHQGGDYTIDFIMKATNYFMNLLWNNWSRFESNPNDLLYTFQTYREKIQTLVLKWPPSCRDNYFYFFKDLLDIYRSDKTSGDNLKQAIYNKFKELKKL